MRPYVLKSHERPLTQVRYNEEGDLLFTCSKDGASSVAVFYSENGERAGTYQGDSKWLLTGSADSSVRLWNVSNGKELFSWGTGSPARAVAFSVGEKFAAYTTDPFMQSMPTIRIIKLEDDPSQNSPQPVLQIDLPTRLHRCQRVAFTDCNRVLVTASEDGFMRRFDVESGKCVLEEKVHDGEITDMQTSRDGVAYITASKDKTAKLVDAQTLQVLKTYQNERPVNSACINPVLDHVAMGGGQDASAVTTTADAAGGFETRFFHKIYEEEFGRVKGHFGPVNSVVFSPDGRSFVTGGEDGFVRLTHFDLDYLTTQYFPEP